MNARHVSEVMYTWGKVIVSEILEITYKCPKMVIVWSNDVGGTLYEPAGI